MPTNMKRFTVSLTPKLEHILKKLKKEQFYNSSQSKMVRYVIQCGLQNIKLDTNQAT